MAGSNPLSSFNSIRPNFGSSAAGGRFFTSYVTKLPSPTPIKIAQATNAGPVMSTQGGVKTTTTVKNGVVASINAFGQISVSKAPQQNQFPGRRVPSGTR